MAELGNAPLVCPACGEPLVLKVRLGPVGQIGELRLYLDRDPVREHAKVCVGVGVA